MLVHLPLVALTTNLSSRHFRLGKILHGLVFVAVAIIAADFIFRIFVICVGAIQVLFDNTWIDIDVAAYTVPVR